MSENASITGFWVGDFSYSTLRQPSVSFLALLQDSNGRLTGTTSERDPKSSNGGVLRGIIYGTRTGPTVFFIKAYDGAGRLSHAVNYSGKVSEDGLLIEGIWQLEKHTGPFTMWREKLCEAEVEGELLADLDV